MSTGVYCLEMFQGLGDNFGTPGGVQLANKHCPFFKIGIAFIYMQDCVVFFVTIAYCAEYIINYSNRADHE